MLMAQNPDAEAIKKKMTSIRQSTNWKNKEDAAKANQEISKLSKQLMMLNTSNSQNSSIPMSTPENGSSVPLPGETSKENVDFKMALWDEIWNSARKGKDAKLDLAKPLRDSIVAAYKEDDSPVVKCPDWFTKMNLLYLDMSMPGIDAVIEQMDLYQSIEILIITGGEYGVPVDLNDLLSRAANYPLKCLYIINFGNYVNYLPSGIGNFRNITEIGLFNNALNEFPEGMLELSKLKVLYLDKNPVYTIMPDIGSFPGLKVLGLSKTSVSEEEILSISNLIPDCEILR